MKLKNNLFRAVGILTCLTAASFTTSQVSAANHTWDGGGAPSGSWLTGTNWDDDAVAVSFGIDSIQTFNASGAGNLTTYTDTSPNLGTLNFNADADGDVSVLIYNNANGTLGVDRTMTFTLTTGTAQINVDADATGNFAIGTGGVGSIKLSNPLAIDHNGTGNLTISRPIALTTPGSLLGVTKTGSGTLTLSAANTFDGGLTLSAGTVNLNNASAAGSTAGTFTINGGAIDNTVSPAAAVNLGARPLTINGDFTFKGSGGAAATLNLGTGATTLGTAAGTTRTITVSASTLTIAGIIADGTTATGITKEGGGVLTLNGKSTFTSPIQVNSGSLTTGAAATFTSSGLTIGGAAATGAPALAGSGTLSIPTTISSASGGVVGTQQPGGTTAGGIHTFNDTLTYGSGAILAWQVNTIANTDPGADTANHGNYDKVVANGAPGSVTGGAAVFRIAIANSSFADPFWDTNKSWTNIYSGTGAPASLSSLFSSFAGVGVDANGFVAGEGQFTFVGSTLQWTAGAAPTNLYDIWSAGLANPAFDFDSDNDGIENGLEWILGGNANQNDTPSILPVVNGSATSGLTMTFTREEDAIFETTLTLEYTTDLAGPWTSEVIDQDGGSLANGVIVTVDEIASPDAVIISIPASNAVAGKLFARLKAVRN